MLLFTKIPKGVEVMSDETKVWCPNAFCNRFKLFCIYKCPEKVECGVYERKYEEFKKIEVPEYYIQKYGPPEFPIPNSIILKEKLHTKKEKEAAKKEKEAEKLNKKVARERKKQLKIQAKEEKQKVRELKKAEKLVPKPRKRRTTAEVEFTELKSFTNMINEVSTIAKSSELKFDKPKRHRRTKAEMQAARGIIPTVVAPNLPSEVIKPKRHRRTKAQMEADHLAERMKLAAEVVNKEYSTGRLKKKPRGMTLTQSSLATLNNFFV